MPKFRPARSLPLALAWFITISLPLWLMFKTIGYDPAAGSLLVGGKYYSDFASHLPLIRSFSLGQNWPPQLPIFPGEPIRYHYLFFAAVGFLEQLGVRLDFALNLPSALGLSALSALIWLITVKYTGSYWCGLAGVAFVFFNSSLSWLEFLREHDPLSLPRLKEFVGFRPWNSSLIAPFWNLNIYSNQRHLGLSLAIVMLAVYPILFPPRRLVYLSGFLAGSLLLINQAAAAVCFLALGFGFLFHPPSRKPLILSSIGFLPWLFFYQQTIATARPPVFEPGFLADKPLSVKNFLNFWVANTGPIFVIGLAGMFAKRQFLALTLFLATFLLGCLFRFSPDMINNHKLFNFLILLCIPFSVWLISKFPWPSRLLLIFLLSLGGVVDFFPIKNDSKYAIPDFPTHPDVKFFVHHTPPDAVILNSNWFYHPASLAGRKIFNGYSYFTWSYGYDQITRESEAVKIYSAPNKAAACGLIKKHSIDYVDISGSPESFIPINRSLWFNHFETIYTNPSTGFTVIDAARQCP